MATKYIEAAATFPGSVADAAGNVREIYVDTDTEVVKVYDKTASAWRSVGLPTPQTVTASATLSLEEAARPVVLNAVAGLTLTLPVATGSGAKFRIYVGTTLTSVSYIINCAGSDKFYGGVLSNDTGGSAAVTADYVPASQGTSVTFTLAFANAMGLAGDYVEITDIAALKWHVWGALVGSVDPASPWS